jgi:NAD-dependent dihydropyrimidine dehydrogenase PreA subunit
MRRVDDPASRQNQPEVDPRRCVHSAAILARCSACVERCPRSSWILSDSGLGLDTASCDGCAICAAACPQTAIVMPHPVSAVVSVNEPDTALVACEVAVPQSGKGIVPCLHAIGLNDLARLHRNGVRGLVAARCDCVRCDRYAKAPFDQAVADVARLLADRDLPDLAIDQRPAAAWVGLRDQHLRPSRRALFAAFRPVAPLPETVDDDRLPAAQTLPAGRRQPALHPFLPVIDSTTCAACDACARICPQQAIRLETDGPEGAAYVVDPPRCTGCRLCVDVCEAGAVTIAAWRVENPSVIHLDAAQCTACGNMYHLPQGRGTDRPLCRICAKVRHTRNLFQVMK